MVQTFKPFTKCDIQIYVFRFKFINVFSMFLIQDNLSYSIYDLSIYNILAYMKYENIGFFLPTVSRPAK